MSKYPKRNRIAAMSNVTPNSNVHPKTLVIDARQSVIAIHGAAHVSYQDDMFWLNAGTEEFGK